jgi:hypothetical protein
MPPEPEAPLVESLVFYHGECRRHAQIQLPRPAQFLCNQEEFWDYLTTGIGPIRNEMVAGKQDYERRIAAIFERALKGRGGIFGSI